MHNNDNLTPAGNPVPPHAVKPVALDLAVPPQSDHPTAPTPDAELVAQLEEWQRATYLLLGAVMKQHGRRRVEVKPRELERFAADNEVAFSMKPDGTLCYEITKKPKGK